MRELVEGSRPLPGGRGLSAFGIAATAHRRLPGPLWIGGRDEAQFAVKDSEQVVEIAWLVGISGCLQEFFAQTSSRL